MTKVQNPIIGRSRGSAGGMTFSKNFDKNVIRAKAFEVKNPKTTAQTTQRDFFKQVQEITSTVTDEQLRSLFGDMPKSMSRRNALSKQITAAYTIEDGVKSVDFSKLLAIGNGEKINVPIVEIIEGNGMLQTTWPGSNYKQSQGENTILIYVIFDETNSKIVLGYLTIANNEFPEEFDGDYLSEIITGKGYGYITEATIPLEEKSPFGSFTIKTRAVEKNANSQSNTPRPGDVVTVNGLTINSSAILSFNNYDMNDLLPGDLIQKQDDEDIVVVNGSDWDLNDYDNYESPIGTIMTENEPVFLKIMQNDTLIDTVPFALVVE